MTDALNALNALARLGTAATVPGLVVVGLIVGTAAAVAWLMWPRDDEDADDLASVREFEAMREALWP